MSLLVQNELQTNCQEDRLESSMKICLEQLRRCSSTIDVESEKRVEVEAVFNNQLCVGASVIKPLCEFSYSYVEFPDTPCGSYSILHVDLNVIDSIGNCICGYADDQILDYQVHFKLSSDCDQINIEPTCGTIKNGQVLINVEKIF